MIRGTCEICGEPVTREQTAAYPITGWEVERQGGGANSILDRERQPDRIAHATCVRHRSKYGAQTAMM